MTNNQKPKSRFLTNLFLFMLALLLIVLTFSVFNSKAISDPDYNKAIQGLNTVVFMIIPFISVVFGLLTAIGMNKTYSYYSRFNRASIFFGIGFYFILFSIIFLKS